MWHAKSLAAAIQHVNAEESACQQKVVFIVHENICFTACILFHKLKYILFLFVFAEHALIEIHGPKFLSIYLQINTCVHTYIYIYKSIILICKSINIYFAFINAYFYNVFDFFKN